MLGRKPLHRSAPRGGVLAILLVIVLGLAAADPAQGQPPVQPDEPLTITLAEGESFDLRALVRWLADTQDLQIIVDEALPETARVQFFGRVQFDRASQFQVVQVILRANNFAMVDSDVTGWLRIVPMAGVRAFAPLGDGAEFPRGQYVTGVFRLTHMTPQQAEEIVRKLAFGADGVPPAQQPMITSVPGENLLIITEMANRLQRVQQVLAEYDRPAEDVVIDFYTAKHLDVNQLHMLLNTILADQQGAQERIDAERLRQQPPLRPLAGSRTRITADPRMNRLILIGPADDVDGVLGLITRLDVDLELRVLTYRFQHIPAGRIDEMIRQSLAAMPEETVSRVYQSVVEQQDNRLIVTATDEIHGQIGRLRELLDRAPTEDQRQSPVRFYTLRHVQASDVLETIRAVEGTIRTERAPRERLQGIRTRPGFDPSGVNQMNPRLEGQPGPPPFLQEPPRDDPRAQLLPEATMTDELTRLVREAERQRGIIPGDARVTIDEHTNMLIVVADPAVQQLYEELIQRLDRRRPQVLIEAIIVTIDGREDFNLGIEISGGDRSGLRRLFAFTSFGLSEVDPVSGALSIIPGVGFNGTLVDPDTADVILRALSRHRRGRVVAAPRVLVNDNATGLLQSVAEVPFASINATQTVATTSFAGFAQAGTTISVTPQIGEDDYLNLEFDILVNTFTGAAVDNLPPPRSTDQVTSQISIPDGHTVIVGGLSRRRVSSSRDGVPFIDQIPILNLLGSRQAHEKEEQRIYVFLKPIILRDDKFRDLRFLSQLDRSKAVVPDGFPKSAPVLIE